ncbi:MAG: hypothetical protein J6W36_08735 [Clostridiales bacterium]|nr:hypothetical protein [Clostridiales bacterium]
MTTSTWIVLFICCFLCPMTTIMLTSRNKKDKEKTNDMDKEKNNDPRIE